MGYMGAKPQATLQWLSWLSEPWNILGHSIRLPRFVFALETFFKRRDGPNGDVETGRNCLHLAGMYHGMGTNGDDSFGSLFTGAPRSIETQPDRAARTTIRAIPASFAYVCNVYCRS